MSSNLSNYQLVVINETGKETLYNFDHVISLSCTKNKYISNEGYMVDFSVLYNRQLADTTLSGSNNLQNIKHIAYKSSDKLQEGPPCNTCLINYFPPGTHSAPTCRRTYIEGDCSFEKDHDKCWNSFTYGHLRRSSEKTRIWCQVNKYDECINGSLCLPSTTECAC